MVDTVNYVDYFMADAVALVTDGNFYDLLVYDPIRFSSNVAALFELCSLNRLLDMGYTFTNLDPIFISETLTRQLVISFTTGGQLISDVQYFANMNGDNIDDMNFWEAGLSGGRLMKALLDFNLDN